MEGSGIYLWAKAVHVLAVVLFLGNIIVTAVWKRAADRSGNRAVVEFGHRLVVWTDWVFTGPAAFVLLASGLIGVFAGGLALLEATWLRWGLILFGLSGLVWVAVLIPVQRAQSRILTETPKGEALPEAYFDLCRLWLRVGLVANVFPVVALFLMILKPV